VENSILKTGKTVESALEDALKELNLTENEVTVEVIEEATKGILGIGGKPATIKVTPINNVNLDEVKEKVNDFLGQMTSYIGLNTENEINEVDEKLKVNIVGKESMGILIGYRGETLEALQYLTNLVANKNKENYVRVELDTENYRAKRKETLEGLARKKAADVIKYGKRITLEPMTSYERRIIHYALQDNDKVTTNSVGQEPYRKIIIEKREG